MSGDVLLELHDVSKSVDLPGGDELTILEHVSLKVHAGESLAIVGRSGSGKSTLLNILGLLDSPSLGNYSCEGRDTSTLSDRKQSQLRGQYFGFVFQQFHLLDRRTALENVAEPLLFGPWKQARRRWTRSTELLERVGLSHRTTSMPHQLSGGEQQRVALARALVRSPRVLLADEPTGSLDGSSSDLILDLLYAIRREESLTLIVVTHDTLVAERADQVVTLEGGKVAAT